ncbi:MAG: ATP-dependent Clp protease ATP-binding subunit [Clostridia bacterium]|nr:ATP-dependent Clp protease ATP-binding subunit [Clostridia bacterium]
MNIKYTAKAAESLRHAEDIADMLGHSYIGSEHLLIGLIQTEGCLASSILINNGVTEDRVINMVYELIAPDSSLCLKDKLDYTPRLSHILEVSSVEAARFNEKRVGTEHLLIALMKETEGVAARLLNTMGINVKKLFKDIVVAMGRDIADFKDEFKTGQPKSKKPQMLAQYSRDLTEMAKNGKLDAVIGRQNEINRVIQILSRRTKNNPCLIGEPGVGKTAIVEGLASRIVEGDVPDTIINKRVLTLDLSGMVAGSKYRGEFEERIKKVIDEVKTDGNILLFLDELHTVIGAGGAEGAIDASNILKPSLARGEIQLIGATTLEEYRKHIEKDAALERRFQPVKVEEPTEAETVEILNGLKERYEEFHNVVILPEAIQAAAKMSKRYINDRFLPDKAIDLIDEAASKKKLSSHVKPDNIKKTEKEIKSLEEEKIDSIEAGDFDTTRDIKVKLEKKKEKLDRLNKAWEKGTAENNLTIGENDIAEVVSMWTKIPVSKIQEEETERLLKLENTLHDRVIGQSEAVSAVAKAIRRGRVGLNDPNRPIGSFLFLGPTGVGKTELSKALAYAMFGSESSLIRVDMSEFMEKHTVSKLIGSPPGYVGYDEGGQMSEKVRRNPYSVVLFDEIEKAHPDIFNVLLQVLDDGRITDSTGRVVDFKNTVIIMTSNAGAQNIIQPKNLGFMSQTDEKKDHENMKNKVMEEVKKLFKPEFLNRIDDIIVFHTLSKDEIGQIVDLMINSVNKRTQEQMKISIELDKDAKDYIVSKGYDSKYGARPLRRTIQNEIENVLAEKILEGEVKNGSKVLVSCKDGKLSFSLKRGRNR